MPDRFLVCVDFSALTDKTLQRAIKLAGSGEVVIDLLHIVPPPRTASRGSYAGRMIVEQAQKASRDAAHRKATPLLDRVPEPLRGEVLVRDGIPADEITELAKKGYDMVILATHGRTGMSKALLGSVAERVVRYSPIPVLVVR
ncbi:MAG: universal stress protein [Deltaproteobacteria bacterium]|nr:MAG: universal stress protein [Deltaproteobacteria bacterium]